MKAVCIILVLIISGTAIGGTTSTRIEIATVPDEYTPTNASIGERVSMADFALK